MWLRSAELAHVAHRLRSTNTAVTHRLPRFSPAGNITRSVACGVHMRTQTRSVYVATSSFLLSVELEFVPLPCKWARVHMWFTVMCYTNTATSMHLFMWARIHTWLTVICSTNTATSTPLFMWAHVHMWFTGSGGAVYKADGSQLFSKTPLNFGYFGIRACCIGSPTPQFLVPGFAIAHGLHSANAVMTQWLPHFYLVGTITHGFARGVHVHT
jgi:hypothetical protein